MMATDRAFVLAAAAVAILTLVSPLARSELELVVDTVDEGDSLSLTEIHGASSANQERKKCPDPCRACPTCPASPACPAAPPCPRVIPPGYRHHKDLGYYKMHYEPRNWFDAKETCEREGGYLAVMNSSKEADIARKLMKRYEHIKYIHVGFHDLMHTKSKRNFLTVLGDDLTKTGYNVWGNGQPSRTGKELCGSLNCIDIKLNDVTCSSERPFLCEL